MGESMSKKRGRIHRVGSVAKKSFKNCVCRRHVFCIETSGKLQPMACDFRNSHMDDDLIRLVNALRQFEFFAFMQLVIFILFLCFVKSLINIHYK